MKLLTYLLMFCLLSASALAQGGSDNSAEVSITIDDMDLNGKDMPKLSLDERNMAILAGLRKHRGLKAALFVCGMRVDNVQGKERLAEWDRAGHLIANHSYSHL